MKLASWTYGYEKTPLDVALKHIASVGYRGCELATGDDYSTPIDSLDDARVDEVRRLFDQNDLEPTAVSALWGLVVESPTEWSENWRKLRRAVEVAVKLGAPYVALCSGVAPKDWHREQTWALLQRNALQLAEYAGERGIVCAIEGHWGHAVERPGDTLELLATVNLPSFRVNLDVCHAFAVGYDLESIVKILGRHAVYAHVCDVRGRYPGSLQLVNPGEGEIDWAKWLGLLHANGFYGWISTQVSVMRRAWPEYDPFKSSEEIYRVLTDAMRTANVPRLV